MILDRRTAEGIYGTQIFLCYAERTNMKKIFREFSFYTVAQFTTQLFSFIGVLFVSKYLGPNNLGLYAFAQNFVVIFYTIISGLDFQFTWHLATITDVDEKKKFTVQYVYQKLVLILALVVLGISISWIVLPKDVALLCTLIFSPLVFNCLTPVFLYATQERRAKLVAIITTSASFLVLAAKLICVYFEAPLTTFALVTGFDSVFIVTVIAVYYLKNENWKSLYVTYASFSYTKTWKLIVLSKNVILYTFLWQIVIRADQLTLAVMTNAKTLGIYSSAVRIAELPNVFIGIFGTLLASRLIHVQKNDEVNKTNTVKKILLLHIGIGFLATLFLVFTAPVLVHLLFGDKFISAFPILRVYAFSIPGLFAYYYISQLYAAKKHYRRLMYNAMTTVIVTMILMYVAITYFGVLGVACASVLTYTLAATLLWIGYVKPTVTH